MPSQPSYTAHPKFVIGAVLYAPPGGWSLTYGPGLVWGTTVSTTQTWTSAALAVPSVGDLFITIGNTFGGASATTVDVAFDAIFRPSGPPTGGINHDYDVVVVYPGPNVNVFVAGTGQLSWGLDFSNYRHYTVLPSGGLSVRVGCLMDGSSIVASAPCATLRRALEAFGITSADYPAILGANPFASPNSPARPDPFRYALVGSVCYGCGSVVTTGSFSAINRANPVKSTYTYTVNSSVSASYDGASMKNPNGFTWTHSSTYSNEPSTGTISIDQSYPPQSYAGPVTIYIYRDTIFKTLLFSY